MKKYSTFFKNKTCDICKHHAKLIRFYNGKTHVLCDSKICDKKSRIKLGLFGKILNITG